MENDLILKMIPSLKDTCVRNQKYELASEVRTLEKDIQNSVPCKEGETYKSRYESLMERMGAAVKYRNSLVGESFKVNDETAKSAQAIFKDANAIRNQCMELLKTADSMNTAAFEMIKKSIPEMADFPKHKGLVFCEETNMLVVTGNE